MALVVSLLTLTLVVLTGCAKRIDGVKVYDVKITGKVTATPGKGYSHELIKLSGTTSAPDNYQLILTTKGGTNINFASQVTLKDPVKVKNGKFTGYVDPLAIDKTAKKGSYLTYYLVAVARTNKFNAADRKQISHKFNKVTTKLTFNPAIKFANDIVKKTFDNQATLARKKKGIYTITPKKGSILARQITKAMQGNTNQWNQITSNINLVSREIRANQRRATIVLVNPKNHQRFLYVSINGHEKYNALKNKQQPQKTSNNAEADEAVATNNDYDDGDDWDYEIIEEWWEEDDYWEVDEDDDYYDNTSDDEDYSDEGDESSDEDTSDDQDDSDIDTQDDVDFDDTDTE